MRRLIGQFLAPLAIATACAIVIGTLAESPFLRAYGFLASILAGTVAAVILAGRFDRRIREVDARIQEAMPGGDSPLLDDGDPLDRLDCHWLAMAGQVRAELHRSEEERARLEAILRNMADGVIVLEADGRIALCNAMAAAQLNIPTVGEFIGARLSFLCRNADLVGLIDGVLAADGDADEREIVLDGDTRRVFSVSAAPLREAGRPKGAILVLHDLTRLKQLEAMRADFVANVSHELRTPLTAIRGYAETLLSGALDDRERAVQFLQIIERHSERLSRLIDDLLTLSDLELGKTEFRYQPLELGPVVDTVLDMLRTKADGRQIRLRSAVPEELPSILADRDRLEQVLINLIDNAIKYSRPEAEVTVHARRVANGHASSEIEIDVVDSGIGIPHKDIPRLTERFFRVDRARSRELGGTGLGLAIVKHIVQAHGGSLEIESEPERGTTVRVSLPTVGALTH